MNWFELLMFLSVLMLLGAAGWIFYATWANAQEIRRLKELMPRKISLEAEAKSLFKDQTFSSIGILDAILAKMSVSQKMKKLLQQAGGPCNLGTLVLAAGVLAAFGFLAGIIFAPWFAGLLIAPVMAYLPIGWLRFLRKRRAAAFQAQFAEALELIGRALRAGHSFSSGMQMVAQEMEDPVRGEFNQVFEEYSFGKTLDDALGGLVERVDSQDVRFFSTAVLLQRETGGNLTEILDNLSHIIRDRFHLLRQAKALSAEGRLSGIILMAMVPGLLGTLMVVSPAYITPIFTHPTGQLMLGVSVCLQFVGFLAIKKLTKLDV